MKPGDLVKFVSEPHKNLEIGLILSNHTVLTSFGRPYRHPHVWVVFFNGKKLRISEYLMVIERSYS